MMKLPPQLLNHYIDNPIGTDLYVRQFLNIPRGINYSVTCFPESKLGEVRFESLPEKKESKMFKPREDNYFGNIPKDWIDNAIVKGYGDMKMNPKELWLMAYREARKQAKTFVYHCDDLFKFRGFGPLKDVFLDQKNLGRLRVSDLRSHSNNVEAKKLGFTDHNPTRVLSSTSMVLHTDTQRIRKTEIVKIMNSKTPDTKPSVSLIKRDYLVKVFTPNQPAFKTITIPRVDSVKSQEQKTEQVEVKLPETPIKKYKDYSHKFICIVQRF